MNYFKYLLAVAVILGGAFSLHSCADYAKGVSPPIDLITDNQLNDESQVPFMINGVQRQFSLRYAQMTTLAGGLSDEFFFDARVPNATFPQFNEIDLGVIGLDNNSANNQWANLGLMRFNADALADRVPNIKFTSDATRASALYASNLYGGIARFWYGAYYGFTANEGGGVIAGGPFIPSQAMYDSALAKLNIALQNASTDLQRRTVNTIIAKVNIAAERYPAARTAALLGLRRGDASLDALYDDATINNQWFFDGGRNRTQFVPAARFAQYIAADSLEGRIFPARIVSGALAYTGADADFVASLATRRLLLHGPVTNSGLTFWIQGRFPNQGSAMPFVTWQENELILAETASRSGNNDAALTNVNNVRTFHNLAARTVTALDSIYIERDKQLFATGMRLIDQRRFNRWHITSPANAWRFLPIGLPERNTNPNLPKQ
jgi:hypothetical protein